MTLGEKMDRAMTNADLTLQELADAVGVYPHQLRELFYSEKKQKQNARIYLKLWILMGRALDVPVEYFADDDLDDEITQTLLTVKAIRVEKETKSDTVRAWEKHIDERKKRKFKK
jgi:transcriptional regulator with XRE-family HTH domain